MKTPRAMTVILMALLPAGCMLNVNLAPGKDDSGVAVVEGSWRERIFYSQKADIVAVDGKRIAHSIFTSTVNSITLEPGPHWVEFNMETSTFVGGFISCACAFDFDFRPDYRYQIRTDGLGNGSCFEQVALQLYKESMLMDASPPDGHTVLLTVATTCTKGGTRTRGGNTNSFCRTDVDCDTTGNQRCSVDIGAEFGRCKTHDR